MNELAKAVAQFRVVRHNTGGKLRDTMRTILLVAAGALFLTAPVPAEELTWFGNAGGGSASLVYGTPDSDYALLSFSCESGNSRLSFAYEFEPLNKENPLEVILQVGDTQVSIPTRAEHLEAMDVHLLIGETTLDYQLSSLLTSTGTLHVFVEDGSAEYPLEGAAEAAKDLLATCKP